MNWQLLYLTKRNTPDKPVNPGLIARHLIVGNKPAVVSLQLTPFRSLLARTHPEKLLIRT